VLVTHEHRDHNNLSLVHLKEDGVILRASDFLKNGIYLQKEVKGFYISACEAYNRNHKKEECTGYLIDVDGVRIYASGDTSKTEEMEKMAGYRIDYALLPVDGVYNMDPEEASVCAAIIKARHTIPVHTNPKTRFDKYQAMNFHCEGRVILEPDMEIDLNEEASLPKECPEPDRLYASLKNNKLKFDTVFETAYDGHTIAVMPVKEEYRNVLGMIYGGYVFNLADITCGCAFISAGGHGPTLSGSIDYISDTSKSEKLISEAFDIKKGNNIHFIECRITDETGALKATAHFKFMNLSHPRPVPEELRNR
jgi:uncharacterized protein (TIGR00369 family)